MNLIAKSFIISLSLNLTACMVYRFDYKYYPKIDGWLKLHLIPAKWSDAFKRCDYEGGVLASPSTVEMKQAMAEYMRQKNKNKRPIFTGIHATFSKGDFFSVEGKPLERMPVEWTMFEPDNADNNEDCIIFLEDGTIADANCSDMFPYICFRKRNTNDFMTPCGTFDQEYEINPANENCYKFHTRGKTWSDAFMTCSAEGGYLAIINSEEEAQYLKNLHEKYSKEVSRGSDNEMLIIGTHDWGNHGDWRTIHGTKLNDAGYANWEDNQPDNVIAHCGAMFRRNKRLDDFKCDNVAPFICEKDPSSLLD